MDEEIIKKLSELKIEDYIWLVYLVLIFMSLYSNVFERKYIIYKDEYSKKRYRELIISIFTVILIVYYYFFVTAYNEVKNLKINDTETKKKYANLSLIASSLVLVSGIIFLYIAIKDENLEVEMAFS